MHLWSDLFTAAIRTAGFFGKELLGVLRQPRLIASLVLGPFVILLLFGVGFRGQQSESRTLLVVPNDPSISDDPSTYQEGFAGVFRLQGVTRDEAQARRDLQDNRTDVVVIIPPDVFDQINRGKQVALPVLFTEIDPTQAGWIRYFSYAHVSELNRRILVEVLKQSKGPAAQALEFVAQSRAEIDGLDQDVRARDIPSAAARAGRLLVATRTAREGLARSMDVLTGAGVAPSAAVAGEADGVLQAQEQELLGLQGDLVQGPGGLESAQRRVETLRANNDRFGALAQRINTIPAETLVSPFAAEVKNALPIEPTALAFYTPAVLALLLQHIGVTLSALSSVRDRLLGSLELFRVSPVGAGNILLGKSLGYSALLAVVGVLLTAAATLLLGVPSLGAPIFYWLSVGLTIFAAVGLGFALAVVANTESQAVQLSMLVLLSSVFFGGFFLPLEQLAPWVRPVSLLLPATYGAIDLREVMLRGGVPEWTYLVGPLGLGMLFYGIAAAGLQRQMRRA